MTVGELCNRTVVVLDREASILEAARLMRRHHVGDVVVVDKRGKVPVPVGILTDRDIVVELVAEEVELARISVGDAMSFDLVTALENDELLATVQRMREHGIRRLPVLDDSGALAGILTLDDVLELIAEQLADLVRLVGNEEQREHKRRR